MHEVPVACGRGLPGRWRRRSWTGPCQRFARNCAISHGYALRCTEGTSRSHRMHGQPGGRPQYLARHPRACCAGQRISASVVLNAHRPESLWQGMAHSLPLSPRAHGHDRGVLPAGCGGKGTHSLPHRRGAPRGTGGTFPAASSSRPTTDPSGPSSSEGDGRRAGTRYRRCRRPG